MERRGEERRGEERRGERARKLFQARFCDILQTHNLFSPIFSLPSCAGRHLEGSCAWGEGWHQPGLQWHSSFSAPQQPQNGAFHRFQVSLSQNHSETMCVLIRCISCLVDIFLVNTGIVKSGNARVEVETRCICTHVVRPERMPCEAASIVGFVGEGLHQCCWEATKEQVTLNLDHVGPLDLTTI